MSIVERDAQQASATVREYVGKAWLNTIERGELAGRQVINIKFDRGVTKLNVTPNTRLELWKNNSMREGKQDADFNVRIIEFAAKAPVQAALV